MIFNKLKNKKGNANALPILFVMIATFSVSLFAFLNTINEEIYNVNSRRYINSVDLATRTGFYNIDFKSSSSEYSPEELIALGIKTVLRLRIDTVKFTTDFYDVLWGNMGIVGEVEQEAIKQYIPLKAFVESDTVLVSGPNDEWAKYPIAYYDTTGKYGQGSNKLVFFTLDSEVFTLVDSSQSYQNETNRHYIKDTALNSILTTLASEYSVDIPAGTSVESYKDILIRNKLTEIVQTCIQNFVNIANTTGNYIYVDLFNLFDDERKEFFSSIEGIGFFCFINGLPIKTIASNQTLTTLYSLDFGSSGLTRKDIIGRKSVVDTIGAGNIQY